MSMLKQRMLQFYSVFVGHIHPDVTKRELGELFKDCGEIADVVILVSTENTYNFGFVRYREREGAFRAVRELNRWALKGTELVVDISKDTAHKLKAEKEASHDGVPESHVRRERSREGSGSIGSNTNTSLFLQDTIYLNRLQENCASLHFNDGDSTGKVAADYLMEDVGQMKQGRFPTVWGSLSHPSVNFQQISQKIMHRCRSSAEVDSSFGEGKAVEFLSSLETIMKEIGNVLGARFQKSSETGKDTDAVEDGDHSIADEDLAVKQCLDDIREEQRSQSGGVDDVKGKRHLPESFTSLTPQSGGVSEVKDSGREPDTENVTVLQDEVGDSAQIQDQVSYNDQVQDQVGYYDQVRYQVSDNEERGDIDDGAKRNIKNHVLNCVKQSCSKCDFLLNYYETIISRQEGSELCTDQDSLSDKTGVDAKDAEHDLDSSKDDSIDKNTESQIFDPAILDFHLSKMNDSKTKPSVLDDLFANIRVGAELPARSVSRESSISDESNEGNAEAFVDDSGVELDCFSSQKFRKDPADSFGDRNLGSERSRGLFHSRPGRRPQPENSTIPHNSAERSFDLESYVKNFGRGRGVVSGKEKTTTHVPLGRGVFLLK